MRRANSENGSPLSETIQENQCARENMSIYVRGTIDGGRIDRIYTPG